MKEHNPKHTPRNRLKTLREDCKYDVKFTKQLLNGIRYKHGLSIIELCRKWRICRQTYYNWCENYEEFAYAAKMGELDYASWYHEHFKKILTGEIKGNAGCAIFAMTNIEGINWASKVSVNNSKDEQISTINITILDAPKTALEHKPSDAIEGQVVEASNVVKLYEE